MTAPDFFDSKTTRVAYLGKQLFDLMNLAVRQATHIYEERGLIIPIEASSTLQILNRHGALSTADIAKALDLPHQLATQRVGKLVDLSLVRRKQDPHDGRRSLLQLTKKGRDQAVLLDACMQDVAILYEGLFEEIDCDLSAKLTAAISALRTHSLAERWAERHVQSGR